MKDEFGDGYKGGGRGWREGEGDVNCGGRGRGCDMWREKENVTHADDPIRSHTINMVLQTLVYDSASMVSQLHLLYVAQAGFHTEVFKGGGGGGGGPPPTYQRCREEIQNGEAMFHFAHTSTSNINKSSRNSSTLTP